MEFMGLVDVTDIIYMHIDICITKRLSYRSCTLSAGCVCFFSIDYKK